MSAAIFQNGDLNSVGEILRGLTFPEHNPDGEDKDWAVGCYTTFEVREDARPWDAAELRAFYEVYLDLEPDELDYHVKSAHGYTFQDEGLTIDCAWFWDGDGVLSYAVWQGAELVRVLENWDCKKNYVWRENETLERAFRGAMQVPKGDYFAVEVRTESTTPKARLFKRFQQEDEACAWAEEMVAAGHDYARVDVVSDKDGERMLLELTHPVLKETQKAGPALRPSGLAEGAR